MFLFLRGSLGEATKTTVLNKTWKVKVFDGLVQDILSGEGSSLSSHSLNSEEGGHSIRPYGWNTVLYCPFIHNGCFSGLEFEDGEFLAPVRIWP